MTDTNGVGWFNISNSRWVEKRRRKGLTSILNEEETLGVFNVITHSPLDLVLQLPSLSASPVTLQYGLLKLHYSVESKLKQVNDLVRVILWHSGDSNSIESMNLKSIFSRMQDHILPFPCRRVCSVVGILSVVNVTEAYF